MYDHNQREVADSFLRLYLAPGGHRLTVSREAITERYELCEDLANHLCGYAQARLHESGRSEAEVLVLCHQGLLAESSGVNPREATWVVRRLAELEGWVCPALPDEA
jgi:hypothetical protein